MRCAASGPTWRCREGDQLRSKHQRQERKEIDVHALLEAEPWYKIVQQSRPKSQGDSFAQETRQEPRTKSVPTSPTHLPSDPRAQFLDIRQVFETQDQLSSIIPSDTNVASLLPPFSNRYPSLLPHALLNASFSRRSFLRTSSKLKSSKLGNQRIRGNCSCSHWCTREER